jgi:hypothetical protein
MSSWFKKLLYQLLEISYLPGMINSMLDHTIKKKSIIVFAVIHHFSQEIIIFFIQDSQDLFMDGLKFSQGFFP